MKKLFLTLLFFTITVHSQITVSYQELKDLANPIRNPERGMYIQVSTKPTPPLTNPITPLPAYKTLAETYPSGSTLPAHISLIRRIIRLDDYRDIDFIPDTFIAKIKSDFDFLRNNNLKCVLIFCYTDGNTIINPTNFDPPLARMETHINRLKDAIKGADFDNQDVISSVEAGFIGKFGEWAFTSSVFGNTDINSNLSTVQLDARKKIGNLIMGLCPDRLVAFRTPRYQKLMMGQIFSNEPTLFNINSRIAAHNDCFLATADDMGTYGTGGQTIIQDQDFLANQSTNTFDGGETCSDDLTYSYGSNAIAQMTRFHFNYLNATYKESVILNWKNNDFNSSTKYFDEIRRTLGYRFVLKSSMAVAGSVTIKLQNLGFANVFNPRKAYLVLKNASNVVVTKVELTNATSDVRNWSVAPLSTIANPNPVAPTITLTKNLTGLVCPGVYNLFLELPDNNTALANNPNYSIRLPNTSNGQDVWEPLTGFNNLYKTVSITGSPTTPTISGSDVACTLSAALSQTTNSTTLLSGQTASWTIGGGGVGTFVSGSNTTATAIVNWATLPATLTLTVTGPGVCTTTATKTITSNCCACLQDVSLYAQEPTTPTTARACIDTQSCVGLNLRYKWQSGSLVQITNTSCSNLYPIKNLPLGCKIEVLDSNNNVVCTTIVGTYTSSTRIKENNNLISVNISPNPSKGNYNIKIENYIGKLNIQVFDLNGRLVYNQKDLSFENEKTIDLSNFQSGMYMLKIEGENINYSEKLIKN